MSIRTVIESRAIIAIRSISALYVNDSEGSTAECALSPNIMNSFHEAVSVVVNIKIMGMKVTQAYLSFPDFTITVVPIPSAIAARS